jgi:Prenyltransferase and squalene oxidase repeat
VAVLGSSGPAAAAPTEVRLRVEGRNATLFDGTVTSDAHPVDGGDGSGPHPCGSGAPTPITALADAGLDWRGSWNVDFQDFFVNRLGAEASDDSTASYWAVLSDWRFAVGGCRAPLAGRAEVLWAYGAASKKYLLRLSGPAHATIGELVTVAVRDGRIRPATGADGGPVAGATVGGTLTDGRGTAQLSFATPGLHLLKAGHPDGIRSNALAICVGDALCEGVGAPPATEPNEPRLTIAKLRPGERFARAAGPRILRGTAPGAQVELSLTRRGERTAFRVRVEGGSWRHRLATELPSGRYRLGVRAGGERAAVSFAVASKPASIAAARRAATRYLLRAPRSSPLVSSWAAIALSRVPAGRARNAELRAARRSLRSRAVRRRSLAELERGVLALTGSSDPADRTAVRRWRRAIARRQRANGSFGGDANLTAFGVLALGATQAFNASVSDARHWLAAQPTDDVDTTGAVLWALGPRRPSNVARRALAQMRAAQAPDGGLGTRPGDRANAQSTALALLGLRTARLRPRALRTEDGITPFDYLRARMERSGAVAYDVASKRTPVWVTAQALLALAPTGRSG